MTNYAETISHENGSPFRARVSRLGSNGDAPLMVDVDLGSARRSNNRLSTSLCSARGSNSRVLNDEKHRSRLRRFSQSI
jgi:hypothetical protein